MKKILFIDDVRAGIVPRYETEGLPAKVENLSNVRVDFRTDLPHIKIIESIDTIVHEVPEFEEFNLVFIHSSYRNKIVGAKAMSDFANKYGPKLYRFSGGNIDIRDKYVIKRENLYNHFDYFVRFIDNFGQVDTQILIQGPNDYLYKKYEELCNEIIEPENWKQELTSNWWFYLQDYFKIPSDKAEEIKAEMERLEYFSEFLDTLEELKNQSYRRLFL